MPKKPCAHSGCFRLVDLGSVYCEAHAKDDKRDRGRPSDQKRQSCEYRKWYNKAAWRGPNGRRAQQLAAEPLCALCPDHSKRLATIADHVIPHNGDHGLFWFGELQSLCKSCHDITKQRSERRVGRGVRWGWSIPDEIGCSAIPVIVVCGPPAAGKSTYVESQKAADDIVIDMDVFISRLNGEKWETRPEIVSKAFRMRDDVLRSLAYRKSGRAWFPITAADPDERAAWLRALGKLAEIVIVAPPKEQVISQMKSDPRRSRRWDEMTKEIERWYRLNPPR